MKQRTTAEFIEICNIVHNNKYCYYKTEYTKKDNKIKIICPEHGEFEQIANSHIRGNGCKKCSNNKVSNILSKSINDFIEIAKINHNNKYDYSLVNYINNSTNIKIVCPIHGEFEQTPKNHLNGNGCTKCLIKKSTRKPIEEFIKQSNEIHNNKYDYSLTDYINANTKVKIICPIHGEFKQKPAAHIDLKQGCKNCHLDNIKFNSASWKCDNWIEHSLISKRFDGFKLYVIKLYNETETFYKIGRTYVKLYSRFSQIPYKYKVLKVIYSNDGKYIFDLEKKLKDKFESCKYIPKIDFGGKYECYKI